MDSIYEVSLSLTIKTNEKRKRVPLGKVLSAETISSIRDAAIAYGCVPNSYPISAYEESSINVSFCETKDRTFKGRVVAADKESAEAKAINNLMVVAVEKLTYNMSAIEAVSVKQSKKTRMTTPIIRKEDREATLDMIKLVNGQCYNSGGVKIDVLTLNTPYKYVVEDNGYTYLKLNKTNGKNIFSYHTRIAINLLKMGLLTTSLNLTLDEINVQSALGTDPKKLFRSGSLSWDDKMLSYYDIKRPEDRMVKGMLKMVKGMVV